MKTEQKLLVILESTIQSLNSARLTYPQPAMIVSNKKLSEDV